MKVYKVKVNGKVYEVELESVSEKSGNVAPEKEAPKAVEAQKAVETPKASGQGLTIKAPMQGTILNVKFGVGAAVKKGQTVVILEAMKLENEIVAPVDGVIKQVLVSKGQAVNNQQPLVVIG